MWEYDAVFGRQAAPGQPPRKSARAKGRFISPPPTRARTRSPRGDEERWMCDGKAIYEFDYKQKKLKEYRLPKELQGKAITNGPLPFVFGAKAESMRQRYLMRIFTPPDEKEQIWIEAWPRWQQDAANFHHVHVILDAKTMLPHGDPRLFDPNPPNYKVYGFGRQDHGERHPGSDQGLLQSARARRSAGSTSSRSRRPRPCRLIVRRPPPRPTRAPRPRRTRQPAVKK